MISAQKEFGSYKLVKVKQYDDDATGDSLQCNETHIGACAIPKNWTELELISIHPYNHDTSIFRFALPEGYTRLNLPLGSFLLVRSPLADHDGAPPAIRPYTSIADEDLMEQEVTSSSGTDSPIRPYFELLCKRYDEWGQRENPTTHFLFTRTDHSYKPPGIVSNYIHSLSPGQTLAFRYNELCLSRLPQNLKPIRSFTLIAVGVGVAPMIQLLRHLLNDVSRPAAQRTTGVTHVTLLYGTRSVRDILLRHQLEDWQARHSDLLRVVFCVGSRWANVHWGVKTRDEYRPPSLPEGFSTLLCPAEVGWVNKERIERFAASPPAQDTRVVVCGLPGVYEKLCGARHDRDLSPHSALGELGYTSEMVIKL